MINVWTSAGVYKIQNTQNGKLYIGSAACLGARFSQHRSKLIKGKHINTHLQRAWARYGENAFKFETILVCAPEDCIFYEQRAIDTYRSNNRSLGYNQRSRAESNRGLRWTAARHASVQVLWLDPERMEKRRSQSRDTIAVLEHSKKLLQGLHVYLKTPEAKENARLQLKRIVSDPVLLAKREAARIAAVVKRCKGVPLSAAVREKMSIAAKRRCEKPLSESTRLKMSLAQKRRYVSIDNGEVS